MKSSCTDACSGLNFSLSLFATYPLHLIHWGRVTYIYIGKVTSIGLDDGLSPGRCQAIIWTNAGILLIWPLGTNFSEIFIKIDTFSLSKMHLKMSSGNGGHFVSVSMCSEQTLNNFPFAYWYFVVGDTGLKSKTAWLSADMRVSFAQWAYDIGNEWNDNISTVLI